MRCSKCGAENRAGARFCDACGTALGATAPGPAARAAEVGAVEVPAGPQNTAIESLDDERKTVTALFADLKGSTELMEALDPEEARAIVDPALRIMIDAVRRYEGYVVQSTGDGIFALFGAPAAYEDHPQRALHAALQMQRELREYGQRRAAQGAHPLEARVGINTGEVVVRSVETGGRVEYTPIGHTANLAARLQAMAPVGSIAVSEYTRKLVEGYFELRGLGPMAVKGISEAIDVYEVTGLGAQRTHFQLSTRRGLTKFVGREHELEQIQRALGQALNGRGQIVAAMAEAGTGKSRLFHEFKATLPARCKVLEAYSVSHGKASAWLPVLELLRGYFGLEDTDDTAARREKVGAAVAALDPALEDTLPYLFGLFGIGEGADPLAQMDPQIKRQRTLDAIRRIVQRESENRPLVVIFEDLHWIDDHTQAALDLLAESIGAAEILLLVNYRPEYSDRWSSRTNYTQIRLDPLGGDNAAAMMAALLGESVELDPLKRLIMERTGGNPFFIEEVVQALFDEGTLVRNGAVKAMRSLAQLRLPQTVQGLLAARIDRLSAQQKDLLQTLSVIGRQSPRGVLARVAAHPDTQLARTLTELRAAAFIYEQPAASGVEYVFKHALTQEVAYHSLLIERRKQIHERTGQALESIFVDQLDDHLTQLAHHYSHSDNLEKAVEYLGRAGRQALQRSAHADAIESLQAAIDLLRKLPDSPARDHQELLLQLAIDPALIAVNGWCSPELERAVIRARELCDRLGNPPQLFSVVFGEWVVRFIRAELRAALAVAQQLLQRAEPLADPVLLLFAHQAMGETRFHRGELQLAREHHEIALALDDPKRPLAPFGIDERVVNLSYMSWIQWYLGYPDQALKSNDEAVELARAMSHPDSMAFASGYACTVRELRGEIEAAREISERQLAVALQYGLADFRAGAIGVQGWAMAMQGNDGGIAQIEECIASGRVTGLKMVRPHYLCMLAQACAELGRFDRGLDALAEGLIMADENEDRYCESETNRLRGDLLLKQSSANAPEAQACFERAIEIARQQSAKSWELRATTSLARLLASRGRRDEARAMLADIYGWFIEGFDTADLKDAKALLDDLHD